ncbi:hypothetical protein B9Q03_04820 [Candidatus Marsarchaeota G2 archaeon OSP_D]|jgi:hypothetical protein|uniref:Uncharacterized protein n=7 Tax=Candidatus Marsarchaeota group 2 TaxID=2203771 RepID=A0A2R6CC79_9ARCH|nr:MAG: hypothetical protein B9Q08_05570 [Candidatus Marsarchaeota G2 archaeon ECH_B_SAG-M15]PSN91189.1 MAG: hypothetical protein B9Q03_04820 [Candidatus Marsarchaeota G2 archaeon OSP_D]PSN93936.1 MAG: hypothetical protein B9Q09_04955 [Candidatus Marsarchaeota G2 archaeon ECH_B_SAG-C16]PSN95963.1 MAG: hypothetical protein B9Q06_03885 [Candidatus Marsarchaeota G2 archaeon ECH_B_2]PSO00739.1 MAG: hypothetical protein B9Q07_02715 [Candidatus Marsarchaeota G2 archaeon ECH_B_3]PSO02535.1 MAG: hypot
MIVYTDLMLAAFAVMLLLASTLALTGASTSYEHLHTEQAQAAQKLYTLFASCTQESCAPGLPARSASEGVNLSISPSSMVVWFGS